MTYLNNLYDLLLDMAPWLLVGLLMAGLVKAWLPEKVISRWLGGKGLAPILRGALVGGPLPLCSCSVIPVALGLHRNGASKPATVSFLVATPETGIDSIFLSWTLLGPFMTIMRPVTAILSAVFTGLLALFLVNDQQAPPPAKNQPPVKNNASSCASRCCSGSQPVKKETQPFWQRTKDGLGYAMTDLLDDIAPWIAAGVVLTAIVQTWLPADELNHYVDGGWLSMLLMVLASVPVYVCATASTPIAAAMLYSGLTPGMTLAFLIAGPATNLAPLAIIKRELGWQTMTAYLFGIISSAMLLGFATDWIALSWDLAPNPETILDRHAEEGIPAWLAIMSTLILVGFSFRRSFNTWYKPQPMAAK